MKKLKQLAKSVPGVLFAYRGLRNNYVALKFRTRALAEIFGDILGGNRSGRHDSVSEQGSGFNQTRAIASSQDPASVFSEIYTANLWNNEESRSGFGSTVANTENLRKHLPIILARFKVKTILDAPCGDFNWMRLVPLPEDVSYVGADIVPELIGKNRAEYEDNQHHFILANILRDRLPSSDLMICRDCLIHFSYKDIVLALENIVDSDIRLLLTTTHAKRGNLVNRDIQTGDFRHIDLFSHPFFFPKKVLYRLNDCASAESTQEICLWDKTQLADALNKMSKRIR